MTWGGPVRDSKAASKSSGSGKMAGNVKPPKCWLSFCVYQRSESWVRLRRYPQKDLYFFFKKRRRHFIPTFFFKRKFVLEMLIVKRTAHTPFL